MGMGGRAGRKARSSNTPPTSDRHNPRLCLPLVRYSTAGAALVDLLLQQGVHILRDACKAVPPSPSDHGARRRIVRQRVAMQPGAPHLLEETHGKTPVALGVAGAEHGVEGDDSLQHALAFARPQETEHAIPLASLLAGADGRVEGDGVRLRTSAVEVQEQRQCQPPLPAALAGTHGRVGAHEVQLQASDVRFTEQRQRPLPLLLTGLHPLAGAD
mmetsp:Transcript_89178/g.282166  ORF Transcript_89178/g.282166 Transcript_89178/m.282166 type:complete len:215 (-) Transcript_89178:704-1348(-)